MVEAIVSYAIERLGDLIIEEARFLHGVGDQVKQIHTELKRMRCFLRDADRRQDEDASIQNWISEIRKLAYDAEDVIEIYAIKVAHDPSVRAKNPLNNGINLHKVGSEIMSITSQISDLTRSLQTYGLNQTRDREESRFAFERQRQLRWSYSHIVEEFVVGLEENIDQVVGWLLSEDQNSRTVYICGMGGLGKTTLAKKVYHHNAIRHHFDCFAWAYISQQCKQRDVWEGILLKLTTPSLEERNAIMKMRDDEVAKKLYEVQLEKKCLIILDDIWSNEAWDILSPAFPSQNRRSKIVFTSRNKSISKHVDHKGLLHEPRCLNKDECWALFEKKAFPRKDDPEFTICDDFKRLGKEMVAKCAGLPLAIIVLGGLLANKDTVNEWETIHRRINSYLMKEEENEGQSKVAEVLALSYHDLPYQLKPCFLYLSQFPEDSAIPTKKLIQLWVAEGIVSSQFEIERGETMEDVAERYLGNLISRCMVQVGQMGSSGRIKTCRLHDLMRDLCLSKATQEHFLHVINGLQKKSSVDCASSPNLSTVRKNWGVRRVAVFLDRHVDQLIPHNEQVNQKLRSLVYFHEKKCRLKDWHLIDVVLETFKLLRVLDLEGIKGIKGQPLPKEVGNLLWLKFLSLKRTCMQILPSSLGNLDSLQTLNLQTISKMSWNSTVKIPNVLLKLKRLRHLYLPNWCCNDDDTLQLENLINLQTLVNFPASICNVNVLLKLKKLRKLVLNDPRYFEKFCEMFGAPNLRLDCLLSLSLRTDMLSFPDKTIDVEKLVLGCPSLQKLRVEGRVESLPEARLFPPQLVKLTLWACRLVEDPMATLEKLPNLKFLNGWEMFIGKKMVCSQNGFPQLKSLVLRGLPNLEEWTIENQAMTNLYRLSISDCYRLKTIPDGLKFVASLGELEVRWMSKSFKKRLQNGGEDYRKVQHVPSIVTLS